MGEYQEAYLVIENVFDNLCHVKIIATIANPEEIRNGNIQTLDVSISIYQDEKFIDNWNNESWLFARLHPYLLGLGSDFLTEEQRSLIGENREGWLLLFHKALEYGFFS